MKDKLFTTIFALVLIFIIAISSLDLQIIKGADLRNDSVTRFKTNYINAKRGVIYDRNGVVLAQNVSTYSLYIRPSEIKDENTLKNLIKESGFEDVDFVVGKYNSKKSYEKVLIDKDFKNSVFITKYFADPSKYPGLEIDQDYERFYPQKDLVSHLLGYTGEVTEDDKQLGYRENTEIGKAGIEMSYDTILRGEDGKVSIDTKTQKASIDNQPVNGKDLYLGLDLNIQKKLTEILQGGIDQYKADGGVGILQDIKTGEILAYVSLPTFDNNLFVGGIGEKDFEKINKDPKTPQLDRISNATYPPGSVFKINTSTALLESKSITKDTLFPTGGTFQYGGVTFRDSQNINRGTLNVVGGLCWSSNIFMMKAALQMDDKTNGKAINQILEYGKRYGLGQKTGIDVPEGNPGYISSPQVKKELYNQEWLQGDLLNASIGQGLTLLSPIQIQTMVTAVANGGNIIQPRVVDFTADSGSSVKNETQVVVRNNINVAKSTLDTVREGMYCTVHNGIVPELNSPYVSVSGKSGTAEFGAPDATGAYPNRHGWVTGFFPTENPQFAFTMLLERGGTSNYTARIARTFIDWLYKDYKIQDKGY